MVRDGKNIENLSPSDLSPFENIHARGRSATRDLAQLADIQPGTRVLDVGCGMGGAARTLAAEYDCRVTGIDLTHDYVRAGRILVDLVGLSDSVSLHVSNALDLPFDDGSFDVVWMQHVSMNVPDKRRLYREAWRALRPNGRLAIHEILAGCTGAPHYPVPWAGDPTISFLVRPDQLQTILAESGFALGVWRDDTPACVDWARKALRAEESSGPPSMLDLIFGESSEERAQNMLRNLEERRIEIVQIGRAHV